MNYKYIKLVDRFVVILVTLLFTSCHQHVQKEETSDPEVTIDLEKQLAATKDVSLSNIADSVSYVFLETNEHALLPNVSSLVYIDTSEIFVRGGDYVYHFSADGKFLNRIGAVGMGPMEYPSLKFVSVDSENKKLLLLSQGGDVFFYDYTGKFIKRVHLEGEVGSLHAISGGVFVSEIRDYTNGFSSELVKFDTGGKILQEFPLEEDKEKVKRSMYSTSIIYQSGNDIRYKSPYNDTLFTYNMSNLVVSYIFYLGKYSPSRELIEDVSKKSDLYANYVQIVDITESEQYYFLITIMDGKLHGVVIDKDNSSLVFNKEIKSPKNGGGIKNDIDNTGYFWPMLSFANEKDKMAQLVHPSYLRLDNVAADANPIIQIMHLN